MLQKLKIVFGVLAVISALVWILGLLMSIVVPIFGGTRADRIGAVLFSASLIAEILVQFFGWMAKEKKPMPFRVEKKYGNRK